MDQSEIAQNAFAMICDYIDAHATDEARENSIYTLITVMMSIFGRRTGS